MQLFCFRVSCQPIEIRLLEPFQMKRSCRLHLCFFLRLRSLAHLSLGFPIIYLSILFRPHQKHTIPTRALRGFFHLGQLCAYGGPGGSRTRVQNAFTLKGLQQFFTDYLYCYCNSTNWCRIK